MSPATPAGPITDASPTETTIEAGARAYFAARRRHVDAFVDAHFSLPGTLRLHRAALGRDILRAPVNLTLAVPQILLHLAAAAARRLRAPALAAILDRSILLPTAVSREIEWLVVTGFFALPLEQRGRASTRDALADAIADEAAARQAADPAFRDRIARAIGAYGAARNAAAEITTGLVSLGAGALVLNKLTPGAATLGPALAALLAQQSAIAAFPLGAWLGGLWYHLSPARPTTALVLATTVPLMLALSIFAAFAGVIFDPVQRALGLHRRRLLRMVAALERGFHDPASPAFAIHDHYAARLLDVLDLIKAV